MRRFTPRDGLGARLAYVGVLMLATLAPFEFDFDPAHVAEGFAGAFRLAYTPRDAVDAVRNVALFAGWGVLWFVTGRGPARDRVRWATVSGLGLSLSVEIVQLVIPTRNPALADLATNTLGALTGAAFAAWVARALAARRGGRSYVGLPTFIFAGAYGLAVGFETLIPNGAAPLPGVSGGPLTRLAAAWAEFSWSSASAFTLTDALLFLPAGILAVAALAEHGVPRHAAAVGVTVAGAVLALVVEVAHGTLAIPIEAGAVVWHGLSLAAGAWLAARFLPAWTRHWRGRDRPRLLVTAYAIVLLIWAWRPFIPETDPAALAAQWSLETLIPLQAHAWRVELFSVADIAVGFFLYLPLGALLAAWPVRDIPTGRGILPAVYLSVVTEMGQLLVAHRYADITDVIVQVSAAAIGYALMREAGYRPHGFIMRA